MGSNIYQGEDSVVSMKTTVEIPDATLIKAKHYAIDHSTTLGALIEEGLELRMRAKP